MKSRRITLGKSRFTHPWVIIISPEIFLYLMNGNEKCRSKIRASLFWHRLKSIWSTTVHCIRDGHYAAECSFFLSLKKKINELPIAKMEKNIIFFFSFQTLVQFVRLVPHLMIINALMNHMKSNKQLWKNKKKAKTTLMLPTKLINVIPENDYLREFQDFQLVACSRCAVCSVQCTSYLNKTNE